MQANCFSFYSWGFVIGLSCGYLGNVIHPPTKGSVLLVRTEPITIVNEMVKLYMMCLLLAAKAFELVQTGACHSIMENEIPETCIRSADLFLPGKKQRKKS